MQTQLASAKAELAAATAGLPASSAAVAAAQAQICTYTAQLAQKNLQAGITLQKITANKLKIAKHKGGIVTFVNKIA